MPEVPNVQPEAAPAAAPEAAAAAAPAGQGETGLTSGLSFSLDTVPENLRDQFAPLVKEWDGHVTREFQKRAEVWKPYDELGVRDVEPEELGHLLAFRNIASNDEAFKQWVSEVYQELHGGQEGEDPTAAGAEVTGGEPQYLTEEQLEQRLEQREAQREAEREQQELADGIAREARETLDKLLAKVPAEKKGEIEEIVAFFASQVQGDDVTIGDALTQGFTKYQQMIGAAKSDALDGKLDAPKPAEAGGAPSSAPKTAQTFDEAKERTRARLRAASAV